ncbi:hypothetical protein T09_2172, partial [Trichinella sp. T9]
LMLCLIVDVCINNAFLLMRPQQSYKKTKKHFMKELSAHLAKQNTKRGIKIKKSMDKQKRCHHPLLSAPQNRMVRNISYKTTKSIKMPRARMSQINANSLPFMSKIYM